MVHMDLIGSRSRLYDSVELQGLTHRSRFLFLSQHLSACIQKPKRNTFDESIKGFTLVSFGRFRWFQIVLYGFRSFLDCFRLF